MILTETNISLINEISGDLLTPPEAVGCYHTAVGYYRTSVYESNKIRKFHPRAFQNIQNYQNPTNNDGERAKCKNVEVKVLSNR